MDKVNELKYTIVELIKQAIPILTTDEAKELANIIAYNMNEDPIQLAIEYINELAKKEGEQRAH